MTRSLRRWITLVCLAGFAFAQLTLAAYACPLRAPAPVPAAVGVAAERCPGHVDQAPEQGAVCEAHCDGQTGVTGASAPSVPPLALAPFRVVQEIDPVAVVARDVARTPLDANAAAPPAAQRFCRLLI